MGGFSCSSGVQALTQLNMMLQRGILSFQGCTGQTETLPNPTDHVSYKNTKDKSVIPNFPVHMKDHITFWLEKKDLILIGETSDYNSLYFTGLSK